MLALVLFGGLEQGELDVFAGGDGGLALTMLAFLNCHRFRFTQSTETCRMVKHSIIEYLHRYICKILNNLQCVRVVVTRLEEDAINTVIKTNNYISCVRATQRRVLLSCGDCGFVLYPIKWMVNKELCWNVFKNWIAEVVFG